MRRVPVGGVADDEAGLAHGSVSDQDAVHLALRREARAAALRAQVGGRSFKRRAGTGGPSAPRIGPDTRRGFCCPTSRGSTAPLTGRDTGSRGLAPLFCVSRRGISAERGLRHVAAAVRSARWRSRRVSPLIGILPS